MTNQMQEIDIHRDLRILKLEEDFGWTAPSIIGEIGKLRLNPEMWRK